MHFSRRAIVRALTAVSVLDSMPGGAQAQAEGPIKVGIIGMAEHWPSTGRGA